jgi:hypothetical protein
VDGRYVVEVEGLAGERYSLGIVSSLVFSEVEGARIASRGDGITTLDLTIPGSDGRYHQHRITLGSGRP